MKKKTPAKPKKAPATKAVKKAKPAKKAIPVAVKLGKNVHPYGTARHSDLQWNQERMTQGMEKLDESTRTALKKALAFATERHGIQTRENGTPYVIHPVRIANILMYEWFVSDADMLTAALLHDVVEDTQTTIKEVKDAFGNGVGKLVDGMTMWKGSETYEIYVKRVARGPGELRLIKCADALDNLRSWHAEQGLDGFSRWWRNTRELILPMARSVDDDGRAAAALEAVLNDPWYLRKAEMD